MAWLSCNSAPDEKRAASVGITLTLANIGPLVDLNHSISRMQDADRNTRRYCLRADLHH